MVTLLSLCIKDDDILYDGKSIQTALKCTSVQGRWWTPHQGIDISGTQRAAEDIWLFESRISGQTLVYDICVSRVVRFFTAQLLLLYGSP